MDYEVNEGFVIKDDKTADWALRVIRDNEAEKDRLIHLAKEQIKDLEDQIEEINKKYSNKSSHCICFHQEKCNFAKAKVKTSISWHT